MQTGVHRSLTLIHLDKMSYHHHELSLLELDLESQATTQPTVNHDENDNKFERIAMAIRHYHAELKEYSSSVDDIASISEIRHPPKKKKPVITQMAKMYDISEITLHRHIKGTSPRTVAEANAEKQLLTKSEEEVLVKRLLFQHTYQ